MEIRRFDEHTVVLEDLNHFFCEILRRIPESADTSDDAGAHARLYSSPTDGAEPEFEEEWREYIEPDLRQYFQSALDVVRSDMAEILEEETEETVSTLKIPIKHLESWIHALNQARLVLGAKFDVTDEDMEDIPFGGNARALAVFQIQFYGIMQEQFLRELEREL